MAINGPRSLPHGPPLESPASVCRTTRMARATLPKRKRRMKTVSLKRETRTAMLDDAGSMIIYGYLWLSMIKLSPNS